jgi:prepilin-type N-terminal cleavage/methylation domain-containing protein
MGGRKRAAFTLIELMIVISVISVLLGMLSPVVGRARGLARTVRCTENLRQLGAAWQLYADENRGYCMPQVWFLARPYIYWWGVYSDPPDYTRGLLYPYIVGDSTTADNRPQMDDVFDCPEQPWGSYVPQGVGRWPTTTYGYNGVYFSPFHSGWDFSVTGASTDWRTTDAIEMPSQVFVFADTLLDFGTYHKNNCLLDGPQTPAGSGKWSSNKYPTLCFRHRGHAAVFFADSHAETIRSSEATLTSKALSIGYAGANNAPHYVPDWRDWAKK